MACSRIRKVGTPWRKFDYCVRCFILVDITVGDYFLGFCNKSIYFEFGKKDNGGKMKN